ncbi:MAG TPA: aminoglycoside phosphotransferase family protein [Herpetosiphonaceae bacterium]|nr:aminoglycoside phosphotransferase family protein [Herpetosiphonaceae bacterium]
MHTSELLEQINARHHRAFRLVRRYETGENEGAYAIVEPIDGHFVLKWHRRPAWLTRIEHARRITDRLHSLEVPVPRYVLMGTFPDEHTYWVQSSVPGTRPTALTEPHVEQLVAYNDLQAGQAIAPEQDWATYVRAVVFAGESGWTTALREHSSATHAVLTRLERLVAGKEGCCMQRDDIVHGDVVADNVLVDGERVTGIVDWDAAGCGDRVLDLAKLLFSSYLVVPVQDRLRAQILELRGRDSLEIHLAYCILAQLDWSIHHHASTGVDDVVALAHTIMDDLDAHR